MAPNSIFLNIPVLDLDASIKFYSAIGFTQNKAYSTSDASMMTLASSEGDSQSGAINLMLLTKPFFKTFMPPGIEIADPTKVAQCVICLSWPSKEKVDEIVKKAAAQGAKIDIREKTEIEKQMESTGMYGRV